MAAVVVAVVWGVWEIGLLVTGFLRTPPRAAPPVEAVAAVPEKKPPAKRRARVARFRAAEPKVVAPVALPGRAARQVPFPNARDIRPGTGREELRAEFGEPNLHASLYERGSLLETFVYQNEARSATTYARLRNGSVIAAATAGLQ